MSTSSTFAEVPRRCSVLTVGSDRDPVAVPRVRVARSLWSRFLGLMGRATIESDEGLWLVPCRSIHMFFMRTSIDVAFLDRDGKVVRAVAGMRPWSLRPLSATLLPVRGAWSALELAPGTLRRLGIRSGSQLTFRPVLRDRVEVDDPCIRRNQHGKGARE